MKTSNLLVQEHQRIPATVIPYNDLIARYKEYKNLTVMIRLGILSQNG